jgi:hypothetical protein
MSEEFETTQEHGADAEKAITCPRCGEPESMRHAWRRMPINVMTLGGEEKLLIRAKILKCDRCGLRMGCSCTITAINQACAELRDKQARQLGAELTRKSIVELDAYVQDRFRTGIAIGLSLGPIIALGTRLGNIWIGMAALSLQLAVLIWCYWPRKEKARQ